MVNEVIVVVVISMIIIGEIIFVWIAVCFIIRLLIILIVWLIGSGSFKLVFFKSLSINFKNSVLINIGIGIFFFVAVIKSFKLGGIILGVNDDIEI